MAIALAAIAQAPAQHGFDPSAAFERLKADKTKLRSALRRLPKGGILHSHLGGEIPADVLLAVARDREITLGRPFYARVKESPCKPECPHAGLQHLIIAAWRYEKLDTCCRRQFVRLTDLDDAQLSALKNALTLEPDEPRGEFFGPIWARFRDIILTVETVAEAFARKLKLLADEHVIYLETGYYAPELHNLLGESLPFDRAFELIKSRLNQPDVSGLGITVRFIAGVPRNAPNTPQLIEAAYKFVSSDPHFVAVDLHGEETDDTDPMRFLEIFRSLRSRYPRVRVRLHAGEQENFSKHIRNAILLGAERIGHGVNLIKDPDTMLLVRALKIPVEVSLLSNQKLGYVKDPSKHPFVEYLRWGIPCTLNTDDAGIFDTTLTDEFFAAVTLFDLTWDEVKALCRNSLAYSFAAEEEKRRLIKMWESQIADYEREVLGSIR